VYSERREQFLDEPNLDLRRVHDFADAFISDIERLHKRFKDPILGYEPLIMVLTRYRKVDILFIGADVFVPLLFKDVQTVLLALMRQASQDGVELPTEDMFEVYRKIKELWSLYRQIVRKYLTYYRVLSV